MLKVQRYHHQVSGRQSESEKGNLSYNTHIGQLTLIYGQMKIEVFKNGPVAERFKRVQSSYNQ